MKVQHSIVNNNKLNSVPVVNGQIVYVKDTHDLYFDVDNTRTKATDIIFVDTLQERDAIQSPTPNKVYCVAETNCFYKYINNSWELIGGDVTKSYVDDNFLKKTNTTAFTPTENYHPATKKYVDDSLASYTPPAADVEFDNTGTEIEATTVEEAIIELNTKIGNLNTLIEEINGE